MLYSGIPPEGSRSCTGLPRYSGRMLEEIKTVYFEEPCPFDHLEHTKKVPNALTIPVSGGEQEYSGWRFRWMIVNQAWTSFSQPCSTTFPRLNLSEIVPFQVCRLQAYRPLAADSIIYGNYFGIVKPAAS